jgi:tetratricopeptide (TPR) repeat protein
VGETAILFQMTPIVSQALNLLSRHDPRRAKQLRGRLQFGSSAATDLCGLASALHEQKQVDGAAGVFMEVLRQDPRCAAAHKGLGLLLEENGRFADAIDCYANAARLEPTSEHHYLLGRGLHQAGEIGRSEQHYSTALQLDSGNIDAQYNLGVLFAGGGRNREAIAAFRQVTSRAPKVARAWANLGVLLAQAAQSAEAVGCLEKAVRLEPGNALALANLADALRSCDRVEEARRRADQALAQDAHHPLAGAVRARLDLQEGAIDEARDRLRSLLETDLVPELRGRVLVDLGMARDRLGEYDLAFGASTEGQALLASQQPAASFDREAYPTLVRSLAEWEPKTRSSAREREDAPTPIFLVGFPRSGTTLTEQILCAHPELRSLDEKPLLDRLSHVASELAGGVGYPLCLDHLDQTQIDQLTDKYWQMVEEEAGDDSSSRVIDKMPLNLVHLGLINRLFPGAPLLVALRDPRDCCLSAFMQDFAPNEAMVQFHDLERTTALYAEVMGLWLKRRDQLGNPWLETRYEDLIDDLEGTARGLLEFLGLPWDPVMLDYHRYAARKRISTPSSWDVKKPIFRRAVRRWENYRSHLERYQPRLLPFVEAFGYDS